MAEHTPIPVETDPANDASAELPEAVLPALLKRGPTAVELNRVLGDPGTSFTGHALPIDPYLTQLRLENLTEFCGLEGDGPQRRRLNS